MALTNRFDWRIEMFEGIVNKRESQKFCKLLLYYLGLQQKKLDYYFLLTSVALCDNGLTSSSMFKISNELQLGLTQQDIESFISSLYPILVVINNQASNRIGIINRKLDIDYELMEPLRSAFDSHSHTYLDATEYKKDISILLHLNSFGENPAKIITKQEIHFAIAKHSVNLNSKTSQLTSSEKRKKMRLKYLSIAIKHFLLAVGSGTSEKVLNREYKTLTQYLAILKKATFKDVSQSMLINLAWKLFNHGIELQPQSQFLLDFYQHPLHQYDSIAVKLLRCFSSCGSDTTVKYFKIPSIVATALDDLNLLKLLNTAAVSHWTVGQVDNVIHSYDFYQQHFRPYQKYSPAEVIGRLVEGVPVAFLSRESICRASLLSIRCLIDSAELFTAKKRIKHYINDLDLLIIACVERLGDIERAEFREDFRYRNTPEIELEGKKIRKLQLIDALRKLLKRRLRYTSGLIFVNTALGNFASAQKMFIEAHFITKHPIHFILKSFDGEQGKRRFAKILEKHQHQFTHVIRNRTLHHCLFFICMKSLHDKGVSNDYTPTSVMNERHYIERQLAGSSVFASIYSRNNGKDTSSLEDFSLSGPIGMSGTSEHSADDYSFNHLRGETISALNAFFQAQRQYLRIWQEIHTSPRSNLQQEIKHLSETYGPFTQKFEDFYLILTLAKNALKAGIFTPKELRLDRADRQLQELFVDNRLIEKFLDSTLLRHSRQIRNRSDIELYRFKVTTLYATGYHSGDTHTRWSQDDKLLKRVEANLRESQNYMSLLELWLLKSWHLKSLISSPDTETSDKRELEKAYQYNHAKIHTLINRSDVQLRKLDQLLLEATVTQPGVEGFLSSTVSVR